MSTRVDNYRIRCSGKPSKLPGCTGTGVEIANQARSFESTNNIVIPGTGYDLPVDSVGSVLNIIIASTAPHSLRVPDPTTVESNRLLYILNVSGATVTVTVDSVTDFFVDSDNLETASLTLTTGSFMILHENSTNPTSVPTPEPSMWIQIE